MSKDPRCRSDTTSCQHFELFWLCATATSCYVNACRGPSKGVDSSGRTKSLETDSADRDSGSG